MNDIAFTRDAPRWRPIPDLADYGKTVAAMEAHVTTMALAETQEEIWLVEHTPVITAGTSAVQADVLEPERFPIVATGRGGKHTYHGPGQRVVYPMLDLGRRGRDVRRYVHALESWSIEALRLLGVSAFTSPIGTGIWIETDAGLAKIGAIGVRVRRWICYHGLSINVSTDLSHFKAIVPCGIEASAVARLKDIVPDIEMPELDSALLTTLPNMLHSLAGMNGAPMMPLETGSDCS